MNCHKYSFAKCIKVECVSPRSLAVAKDVEKLNPSIEGVT